MTAAAIPATHPRDLLGAPEKSVTYPISVDYVKSWTLPRALAEVIANAIDADPEGFSIGYDEGTQELVIEDFAEQGVGMESMIFGWSDKTGRGSQIGQFGEGLKIATIRAVSDSRVAHMVIESVGVTIIPNVTDYSTAGTLNIPRKSTQAPRVLVWDLFPSTRQRGTKVRVAIPADVAHEAMDRFMHLRREDYVPPTGFGRILHDEPGKIFIGGVFVSEDPKMVLGYDLALESTKHFQNRDRTIIDADRLYQAVSQVLLNCMDEVAFERLVRVALEGTLSTVERGFAYLSSGAQSAEKRKMIERVSQRVLLDPSKCFYRADESDGEIALMLLDGGYREVMPSGMPPWEFARLMGLLGVKAAKKAQVERKDQAVEWKKNLSAADQAALDEAIALMRRLYGGQCIGKVKVYERVLDPSRVASCETLGFYTPSTGDIALSYQVFANQTDLWETLFHEVAHRVAHRNLLGVAVGQYADRTRGFEDMLGRMSVMLMRHLASGTPLDQVKPATPRMPGEEFLKVAMSGRRWIVGPGNRLREESIFGDRVRAYVSLGFQKWNEERNLPKTRLFSTFASEHYVPSAHARQMATGVTSCRTGYQKIKDICDPLPGVNAAVVWWATVGTMAVWVSRGPQSQARRFAGYLFEAAHQACADLAADQAYAPLVPALSALADGRAEIRPEHDSLDWLAPISALLDQAESMVEPDMLQLVSAASSLPGDPDPQSAWGLHCAQQQN